MLLIVLLIVLALATGLLGFLIKGALWLLALTAIFIIAAFFAGKVSKAR